VAEALLLSVSHPHSEAHSSQKLLDHGVCSSWSQFTSSPLVHRLNMTRLKAMSRFHLP
jgi:hypothetical protein